MVRDPLARLFAEVNDGAQLHVRTFFRITETAGRIALKFGMWFRDPLAKRFTKVDVRHVRTCVSIFCIFSISVS